MNNRMEAEILKYTKQNFATIISIDNHKTYKVIVFANTYNDLCAQFNNLKIIPNTIKGYKYGSFSKKKRKVLKAIELNLDKKYPNLKKCVK